MRQSEKDHSLLHSLWKFVKDKYFLCIHLIYHEKEFIQSFKPKTDSNQVLDDIKSFIFKSDVCIGFLPKKGNASVKSMLKVYKMEDNYANHISDSSFLEKTINCQGASISGINTIAYLGRLELYLLEHHWKSASTL